MIQKLKKSNEGFTLVELIVVIAILGILAAVLVPQYTQYIEKSRQKTDYATLMEIKHAADLEVASVEVAPASPLFTFTITSAGTIEPTTPAPTGSLSAQLLAVIGSGQFKSSKTAGAYELDLTAGKATWAAASQTKLTALQAGTAS